MRGYDSEVRAHRLKPRRKLKLFAPVFALLLMGAAFCGLRWYEYTVTFHPERYDLNRPWHVPKGAEDVWFMNKDNVQLHGWFISSSIKPAVAMVVYFHGNGGNISNGGWLGESLSRRGFDILLFDYRGYGRSAGKISDESDIYADADAAYDYVVNERGVCPDRIVLYGQSLGTAAAVDVGSRRQCGAVILESGLSSASNLAATMLPWLPRWLHRVGKNRFETARKLAGVHCPVLITHGDPDNIIPAENARELYAAANEPKRLILVPGADHNVSGSGGEKYLDEISTFIQEGLAKRNAT